MLLRKNNNDTRRSAYRVCAGQVSNTEGIKEELNNVLQFRRVSTGRLECESSFVHRDWKRQIHVRKNSHNRSENVAISHNCFDVILFHCTILLK